MPLGRNELILLSFLHLMASTALAIVFLSIIACAPRDKMKDPDYGEAVAPKKVREALSAALKGSDPLTMKIGDEVFLEQNQRVETAEPRLLSQVHERVIGRDQTSEGVLYHILSEETR